MEVDAAGNTIATYHEGIPYVLLGSHLDSVPNGGQFDGTLGVLIAMEVAAALAQEVPFGVRVVAFAAEEGARFGQPSIGSGLATGVLVPDRVARVTDHAGESAGDLAAALGLDLVSCESWLKAPDVLGFFEVHIEQGPVLEDKRLPLGIVDAIAGCTRIEITLTGRPGHAGTTPMNRRSDALAAAAEAVLIVEETGLASKASVCTAGRLDIAPNSTTTIPGAARLSIDLRDAEYTAMRDATRRLSTQVQDMCARRGIGHEITLLSERPPIALSHRLRLALVRACEDRGIPFERLASGAGHDAAVVAHVIPAAMLFVPCKGGVSHSPEESCRPNDFAPAVEVLVDTIGMAELNRPLPNK